MDMAVQGLRDALDSQEKHTQSLSEGSTEQNRFLRTFICSCYVQVPFEVHTRNGGTSVSQRASRSSPANETLTVRRGGSVRLMVPKSKLFVVSGPLQGREIMVESEVYSIGSSEQNDLVIRDSAVSRRHCQIERLPDGFKIRDCGSTNGTFVQGVKVSEAFLDHGAELQLGHTRIVFCPLDETIEYGLSRSSRFGELIGQSIPMRHVFYQAERYAGADVPVLIEGETGTGKDMLAESLHMKSARKDKPFIVIDCAALAEDLIASELFGHVKGAFTGAARDRTGAFEAADGGTVFIDEIGTLSAGLQPKLLRVLERKEIKKVGSNSVKKIDVRVICATNRKMEDEIKAGRFREDLFYRISTVRIEMPPLRKRRDDIPLLAKAFLQERLGENAMEMVANFDKAMATFARYDWPGNVRELRHIVELASLSERRPVDLEPYLAAGHGMTQSAVSRPVFNADRPFKDAKNSLVTGFEKEYVEDLLARHDGNISRAARQAGIERAYLQRLIKKHGIKPLRGIVEEDTSVSKDDETRDA